MVFNYWLVTIGSASLMFDAAETAERVLDRLARPSLGPAAAISLSS